MQATVFPNFWSCCNGRGLHISASASQCFWDYSTQIGSTPLEYVLGSGSLYGPLLSYALVVHVSFDGGCSGAADSQSSVVGPTSAKTNGTLTFSQSVTATGTPTLDLTANTMGAAPVATAGYDWMAPVGNNTLSTYTLSAWIYPSANNTGATPFAVPVSLCNNAGTVNNNWALEFSLYGPNLALYAIEYRVGQTGVAVPVPGSGTLQTSPQIPLSPNQWYHVLVTGSQSAPMNLYVNGVLRASSAGVSQGVIGPNAGKSSLTPSILYPSLPRVATI